MPNQWDVHLISILNAIESLEGLMGFNQLILGLYYGGEIGYNQYLSYYDLFLVEYYGFFE